jgi:hypothetical protein
MPRYSLRTLLLALALGPPLLAGALWLNGQWEFWFFLKLVVAFVFVTGIIMAVTWSACVIGERLIRLLMGK